jgi:hypothetical protein
MGAATAATLALLTALAAAQTPAGQDPPKPAEQAKQGTPKTLSEYELKAGFLFQFAKYVEWPATAFADDKAPIVVGIVGQDPFGEYLDRLLKEKVVKGRGFVIQRFAKAADIGQCHILFVPRTEAARLPEIVKAAARWPVLTIGEDAKFARDGGAIGVLVQDEKPKLEVNVDVVRAAELTVDAKLLKAATVLRKEK